MLYKKHKNNLSQYEPLSSDLDADELPFVTVQLPIYNEQYVVERLIDNIVQMDYPKSRMEIQIIDDSTDETKVLAQEKIRKYKAQGYRIDYLARKNRQGYKAGALRDAMPYVRGDFIAIFDADFLPSRDFLRRVLPYFDEENVGVVQTRWDHLNEDYSLLTRLQAFQLNVHFTIEQKGRDAGDLMLQFNGTAGVWRKETIEDAGGWEADTLTEDLDLSYRAQLKGWKIVFREDIASPAELPSEMNGLKSQQFRWMKGGAETAKKMLPTVWKSGLSFRQKFHATMHLLSSSVFLFVFIIGVFSVPSLFYLSILKVNTNLLSIFMVALLSIIIVYFYANMEVADRKESRWRLLLKMVLIFPLYLSLSMGLSLHNSLAVLQGYLGKKSAFVRTPKFNIKSLSDSLNKKGDYLYRKVSLVTFLEGVLVIYFIGGLFAGYYLNDWTFFILHLFLVLGYGTIFIYSIIHLRIK